MKRLPFIILAGLLLAACGEKDQAMDNSAAKPDARVWSGSNPIYMASGWKAGDQAAWEKQIRARNQVQHEDNRIK